MKTSFLFALGIIIFQSCATQGNFVVREPSSLRAMLPHSSTPAWIVIGPKELKKFGALYAISDIHGAYNRLIPLLRNNEIIDSRDNWSAKKSLLVVTGDCIDKGEESVRVIELLLKLSHQASAVGGKIVVTLGNHEVSLLKTYYEGKASITPEVKSNLHSDAMDLEKFISIMDSYPVGLILRTETSGAIFFHSGYLRDADWLEQADQAKRLGGKHGGYASPVLLGKESLLEAREFEIRNPNQPTPDITPVPFDQMPPPSWNRDHPPKAEDVSVLSPNPRGERVRATMDELGLRTVVFGHQPLGFHVPGWITTSSDKRLVKIDVGMPPEVSKGNHSYGMILYCPSVSAFAEYGISNNCKQLSPVRYQGEPRNALDLIRTTH